MKWSLSAVSLRIVATLLATALVFSSSRVTPLQAAGNTESIPGTTLKVVLPEGWKIDKPLSPYLNALKLAGETEYSLSIWQATSASRDYSCISFIGSMQSISALGSKTVPRPSFVPDAFIGSMLEADSLQMICLTTGQQVVSVVIQPPRGVPNPKALTPMLAAIAEAAIAQSTVVSGPGRMKLQLLGVEIPIRSGKWGIQEFSDTWGKNNVLGRAPNPTGNELYITPFIRPGRCESIMTSSLVPGGTVTLVKSPAYTGTRWHPNTLEQFPPPFKALKAYACRNIGPSSILIARIDYEKAMVSQADAALIRQMLDDLGDATERR